MENAREVWNGIMVIVDVLFIGLMGYIAYMLYTKHCLTALNSTICLF